MGRLTAAAVRALKTPGRYGDGRGLMLVVDKGGSRKWVLRIQVDGRRRDIGLGSVETVSLAEARAAAEAIRKQYRDGKDPVADRRKARETIPTFADAARLCHQENRPAWKNPKHAAQWLSSLEQHVFPSLGDIRVDRIDGPMVRDTLAGIWLTVPETARRVRQRILTVMDWSRAKGFRSEELPVRAIARGLPRQPKQDRHFEALPWQDVPAFVRGLRAYTAGPAVKLGFEFMILTAARSGEMRGARWDEIDREARQWRIPGNRMKAGRPHVVPLSDRALEILDQAWALRRSDDQALVFEGARPGRPMSDMTLTMTLRRMEVNATAHGFRSSFRDWAAETTNVPREVAEQALAHTLKDKVERAYRRSDLLEKRRLLMEQWAATVTAEDRGATVVPMARPGA
ncbi:tyrosine-type recombinase/integrase [Roseospira goensis]|uniref:Integrase n=1 Tax=Roseospira goensis TaxID=391922 RepID=A0A7W6S1T0_9PROT|nr:site-specific integrase [Roseospira goensis]MBB4286825.1 integrase [Roseospira goensis]